MHDGREMVKICVFGGLLTAALAAQPGPATAPPASVSVEQAVQEALDHNIGLLAERYNVAVAQARIVQARLRPNPVLSYGLDYQDVFRRGFTVENSAGPPEWNTRVDFTIEGAHKRERRMEVAETAKSVAELNLLNSIRQLTFDVQSAFVDVMAARESVALARENLAALNAIVKVNTDRVRAGDLAEVELLRSQLAAEQFETAVRQAELRRETATLRLQYLMGRKEATGALGVTGNLRSEAAPVVLEEFRAQALRQRPDLMALQRDQARSVADIRLQIAQGKIDYSVGTMYHNQTGYSNGKAMGFFVSVPLPVFNRNQGEVERAKQEALQIQARIRALQNGVNNETEIAYRQYSTSKGLLDKIERTMLSQARKVRDITEYSYRRGEASLVEFLDAQRAYNDTVQSYNEARADYARSLYLVDSISGKSVNP
jgi:outer membrane protein, heavy metal efflux system